MADDEQKSVIPDPTRDLNWSAFRGAIHDIFASNAQSHPDRLCVVETASGSSPRREFTYKQINEASNILAHHLVRSGIQLGEVVMVYAHRGVDLVVAVMGVLKAGATFSVIDPAYPPFRQNIYLDVARPRALVIIEKATTEAGKLTDEVRSFIKENLQLRTEIPALVIQKDGSLLGGSVDGKDVLADEVSVKSTLPGVVVGPDSTPTLSFTSGSEGRPKGVRGRHFSLAYYFPWMSKTFNLSENDKFSMLSGIAHDPIQRDIFTPLFLGAQLLVPSRDDIQNERLAEWMQEHEVTVTHLTPAMGQILVGGATAEFPSLHHAFFVGDILIKRDCRLLQGLAPNVFIVNMYGTTETQRAVSYYEIPSYASKGGYLDSMKDVIPAGRGMLDVQMLVVNRFDRSRLCAVGELGEIYVRAGGLAEGYLGSPDLSEKKFLRNWFTDPQKWIDQDKEKVKSAGKEEPWRELYLGPRDRLYRSGDLGRYTPNGDVECSGRADDQVKIRGFRIELGEIDTHLSQHPLVRENVTLVRRDKDEEPTLVSYLVPEMSKWPSWLKERGLEDDQYEEGMVGRLKRFRPLREDVRKYLSSKLPNYAVPTVIIPLARMPLNPNGKVDKPALVFPDTAQLSAAAGRRRSSHKSALSETEMAVAKLWADLIPGITARMIRPDDEFEQLGGHSITAQRLRFKVKQVWRGLDISFNAIFRNPTLKGYSAAIDRVRNSTSLEAEEPTETNGAANGDAQETVDYANDAKNLVEELPKHFPSASLDFSKSITVFLTGATGFLGAYLLRDLLSRRNPSLKVIALVRAKSSEVALSRVRTTCDAYGVWSPEWTDRLQCVAGNLGEDRFGLAPTNWEKISNEADVVIHNGAQVHWVFPYQTLKTSNVQGTIDALKLCAEGKPKHFAFVSSTSVLDTEDFVRKSERIAFSGGKGISETDDLEASRVGLGNGYGQTKWVGEYLVREAGRRGLQGAIIRPGYITGDSKTGGNVFPMLTGCG
jgi:L-2-aminoadipate reductase